MVTFGDVHQQMSGKNSNWLSDINQCIHYKEPDLDCTLEQNLEIHNLVFIVILLIIAIISNVFIQDSPGMTTKEYTLSLGRNHKLRRKPYSESEDCDYDTDTSGDTRNCDVLSRYV